MICPFVNFFSIGLKSVKLEILAGEDGLEPPFDSFKGC
jgi:hypothetical protein